MTFAPGETVGPYRIIDQVGQGGMAAVFKAYHAALDRYVAIKVMHPVVKEDPMFIARFQREARIVAKLDHPNIIPIYDFAIHEGTPYLVMRYVEGKQLKALMTGQPILPNQTLILMRPIIAALNYAHSRGVLHRDIKPSNIIIADEGQIYLSDFGLARMMQAAVSTASQDTLVGTPQYISPEQAKGDSIDVRSDIYSLGVVLYEMLTGRVPFNSDTPYAVIHDHIFTPVPVPSALNPAIAPELERVLTKALAKEPAARFPNTLALSATLEHAIGLPPPLVEPSAVHSRRLANFLQPKILSVIGLGLVAGLLFALNGHWNNSAAILVPSPTAVAPAIALTTPAPTAESPTITVALSETIAPTERPPTIAPPTLAPTYTSSPLPTNTQTQTRVPSPAPPRGMIVVPEGVFWMGASLEDGQAATNEKPGHSVYLSSFYIDQYEVSNADYHQCVAVGACSIPKGVYSVQSPRMAYGNPAFDDRPVVFVTQGMASQYCTWLDKRLPYEAEWEKAARGIVDARIYPWGNRWEGERANAAFGNPGLVPVTAYSPKGCSPFGACNMSGNAAEWIADYYGANFYGDSIRDLMPPNVIRDPINWSVSAVGFVVRGGSFKSNPFDSRISKRSARPGVETVDDVGFRCAKSIP